MKNVKNTLRVVHFPQLGSKAGFFEVAVKDEEQAYFTINLLANQHLWLFENKVIPDYANIISVEMFDDSIDEETGKPYGWSNYYNKDECMEWDEFVETYLETQPVS